MEFSGIMREEFLEVFPCLLEWIWAVETDV